jgi:hypothetical protein
VQVGRCERECDAEATRPPRRPRTCVGRTAGGAGARTEDQPVAMLCGEEAVVKDPTAEPNKPSICTVDRRAGPSRAEPGQCGVWLGSGKRRRQTYRSAASAMGTPSFAQHSRSRRSASKSAALPYLPCDDRSIRVLLVMVRVLIIVVRVLIIVVRVLIIVVRLLIVAIRVLIIVVRLLIVAIRVLLVAIRVLLIATGVRIILITVIAAMRCRAQPQSLITQV